MTYPGGGKQIQTDTAKRPPKRIEKAVRPFRSILRTVRRGKR